jgi:hypothetical protein
MQERVYKKRIRDLHELRQRIVDEWNHLDQRVIDDAISQWRSRLRACVAVSGGHFEHKL